MHFRPTDWSFFPPDPSFLFIWIHFADPHITPASSENELQHRCAFWEEQGIPTPVRLNYIKIARQQTNFDGCTLEKHHVTFIYSCIHLFVRTSETRIALTTCLQKKRGSVGLLRFQPLTLDIKAVRYFTLMCFFMKKKEKCSRWPLCGASSFVGCLSVCSWRKGTFSLTELERKASAYSQPWNLLAKFLLAIWKISHIAQLESCDPDGELKACGGGRGWREERQEMKNGGWNQGKRARQSLWCTWMR